VLNYTTHVGRRLGSAVGPDTILVEADGKGDDYEAFYRAWQEAALLDRVTIVIPPGNFTIGTQLPALSNSVSIVGAGQGVTTLNFAHSGVGFRWEGTLAIDPGNVPCFEGMTLLAGHDSSTIGIDVSYTTGSSPSFNTAVFRDLRLHNSPDGYYWDTGLIHLTDIQQSLFDNVNGLGPSTSYGIKVDGFSLSPRFIGCNIHFVDKAFVLGGTSEGAYFSACEVVGANYGVYKDTSSFIEPWIVIDACHFNTYLYGVYLSGISDAHIKNCLIWAKPDDPYDTGYVGIYIYGDASVAGASRIAITNNQIMGWNGVLGYAGATTCVQLDGILARIEIDGGYMGFADTGITVGASVTGTRIGPIFYENITTELSDSGTGTNKFSFDSSNSNYTFTKPLSLAGGATGSAPTPQVKLGAYFDNAGNPSVSHIDLFGSQYGWGISAGSLNHLSGGHHRFFVNADPASAKLTVASSGSVVIGSSALATNATEGFLYVPTCAGTPSGTPTTWTGTTPIVYNSSAHRLYAYSGSEWRSVALST
jgi:hypothetical protein